ncbi:Membrane protein involved in the export of O-antigen and teichoic acid [Acidaminococcus fermentans]|uniref:Membrane protein involved in the export of O-antigen and teichoic acid n=1 Tax=Acidaminococcus fermentans TaxID=905 RepID=A0A1H2ZST5_ACIFE|nr:sugar transporter [Acidaminococcus fermentans]SDX20361.1 Membrane protein involved in the export of O-antigen and teichoic acid [Acidaminococcus fermentans]
MKLGKVVKNISYSFSANLLSLLISVFMVMFVPKLLSVNDYGLWQLFLFYYSYLGFMHFGWEDGIYLRYAGKRFEELQPKTFAGQFYGIILLQVVLAVTISIIGKIFVEDPDKRMALICAIWLAPFVNFNSLCNFIMQITNRIKEYARLLVTERIIFFLGVLFFLVILRWNQFCYMYASQVFAVASMSVAGAWLCRSLLIPHFDSFAAILQENYENISVGSKLMLANIASMLIIGIVRYGISMGWDVATFGKVSLTLGVSNFLMVFINSVSVVFFPIVKRMDEGKRAEVYISIRNALTFLLFAGLLGYYPVRYILSLWLPRYADSLKYMSVLFPVCVFESKVSLLINTYLKSMREEFLMLKINAVSVVFSLIVTAFTVGIWHNLDAAVFSIVLVYAFRCILAEYHVTKLLGLDLQKNMIEDLLMCAVFIVSGWAFDNFLCMVVYGAAYAVFVLIHRRSLRQIVGMLRK